MRIALTFDAGGGDRDPRRQLDAADLDIIARAAQRAIEAAGYSTDGVEARRAPAWMCGCGAADRYSCVCGLPDSADRQG